MKIPTLEDMRKAKKLLEKNGIPPVKIGKKYYYEFRVGTFYWETKKSGKKP